MHLILQDMNTFINISVLICIKLLITFQSLLVCKMLIRKLKNKNRKLKFSLIS